MDVSTDPANSCALFITVHSHGGQSRRPALSAKFQFEDHIRCVAARQCLQRNRENLRLAKMTRIAKLLHLPVPEQSSDAASLGLVSMEQVSSVGSFLQLSASPRGDLLRSGLHQGLQEPSSPDNIPSQNIEMDQFLSRSSQSESLYEPKEKNAENTSCVDEDIQVI